MESAFLCSFHQADTISLFRFLFSHFSAVFASLLFGTFLISSLRYILHSPKNYFLIFNFDQRKMFAKSITSITSFVKLHIRCLL